MGSWRIQALMPDDAERSSSWARSVKLGPIYEQTNVHTADQHGYHSWQKSPMHNSCGQRCFEDNFGEYCFSAHFEKDLEESTDNCRQAPSLRTTEGYSVTAAILVLSGGEHK